ncbi:unnamed protein product [Rotaria sp. Silwood1]|nr:unnamed protein product [Rotaria sp. Silwood1]CAF1394106.1 unnamed protein product [Rotaria sp. Silwood1]CAF1660913.1 unnamed protein product [Rotaria sp. Silwood1]CAF1660930.1 unnamed protein product [Rotaria sp. Silwood1]
MNLSAWIDLQGLFVELPIMISFIPEGWAIPSVIGLCLCAANIMPAVVAILRWYQGKRFSEIPYIYIIIIIGIVSCCVLAFSWQKTTYLFGRERSLWLIGSAFTLCMLDSTSSLVFFDYMKRFRIRYLTAVFLGEGLTGVIPTLLLLAQGSGGEAICVKSNNGTTLEPIFTQPRFSVTIYMLLIASIIIASLIAFVLLRWTNIVSLADATEPTKLNDSTTKTTSDAGENSPMVPVVELFNPSKPVKHIATSSFICLLCINTYNSFVLYGILPSLSTYSLLPYGQRVFYYFCLLNPLSYSLALLVSVKWATLSVFITIIGTIIGSILAVFIIIIATQSPCPWWADTLHGALIMLVIWFLMTVIIAYLRITTGNFIKGEWSEEKVFKMFQRNHRSAFGIGHTRTRSGYQTNIGGHPQWEIVSGKVVSSRNSADVFHGNEILEVSVVNASLMDAPSILLGRQKIRLQAGQRFPIRFQFYYDKSRAGPGYGGRTMQVRITNYNGHLLYINDMQTPLKHNVKIDVKRV